MTWSAQATRPTFRAWLPANTARASQRRERTTPGGDQALMEKRIVDLEQRLARAERLARGMFVFALAVLFGALTLMTARSAETQPRATTVKAPFRVVDDQGKLLLEVGADQERSVLRLF